MSTMPPLKDAPTCRNSPLLARLRGGATASDAETSSSDDELDDDEARDAAAKLKQSEALAAAVEQNKNTRAPGSTQSSNYRQFTKFIDKKRREGVVPGNVGDAYITGANVDLFFQEVIAYKKILPNSAAKFRQAIQKFADQYEHPTVKFDVASRQGVKNALVAQQNRYIEHEVDRSMKDPHANLPIDVLGFMDHVQFVSETLKSNNQNWRDLLFSWNTASRTLMRQRNCIEGTMADLHIDQKHPPAHAI